MMDRITGADFPNVVLSVLILLLSSVVIAAGTIRFFADSAWYLCAVVFGLACLALSIGLLAGYWRKYNPPVTKSISTDDN